MREGKYFSIWGIVLAITSLITIITAKINAQTVTDSTSTAIVCSYETGNWGSCDSSGKQYRTVSAFPSGCISDSEDIPEKERVCETCLFSYTSWGECDSSGKQSRKISSTSPSICFPFKPPILEQTCSPTQTETTRIACSYSLSDWSTCNSLGKQKRTILSRLPENCYDTEIPSLERACVTASSDETSTNNSSENEETIATNTSPAEASAAETSVASATTPFFKFLNLSNGDVLRDSFEIKGAVENAYHVEFYIYPTNSNIPKYIGSGKRINENQWNYPFDSRRHPNGSFFIKPKIKNAYGSYEGPKIMVIILNKIEVDSVEKEASLDNSSESAASSSIERTTSEWQNKYFNSENCPDSSICGGTADPDGDGLDNNEESRYGTNPKNPDSDQDGYLDGDEVKNGYNPLQSSPGDKSDKIIFENPKEAGDVKSDLYKVETVEMLETQPEEGGTKNNLKLTGKALPGAFITLYIYSDPIILTVKSDEEGNWSYILDKEIEDGEHEVYVAITDNTGKITSKSERFSFVKTAEAVTAIPPAEAFSEEKAVSPTANWSKKNLYLFIAIALAALALALSAIGLLKHSFQKKSARTNSEQA